MLGRTNIMSPKTELEEITINPGMTDIIRTAEAGKGFSKVTVPGDADLIPGNIREGVELFGVTGTMKEKEVIAKSGTYTLAGTTKKAKIPHGLGKVPNYFGITNASLYTNYNSASVYVNADATNLEVEGYTYLGSYDYSTTINWNAVYIGG